MANAFRTIIERATSRPGYQHATTRWIDTTAVDSTDKPCTIETLDVQAQVCGLYAEVTQTLEIRNPNHRDISVNVALPLPDRATVCGYALDIHGQLVDGVIVEKERARVAFETEQRRGVDPGLVEAVKGNAYRTRVYPVPPRGTRTIQLRYVSPLLLGADGSATLELPMPPERLERRKLRIDVEMIGCPQPIIQGIGNALMSGAKGFWHAESEDCGLTPDAPVRVSMPELPNELGIVERDDEGTVWFSASALLEPEETSDVLPLTTLTVLWDASGSRAAIDHEPELALLKAYCSAPSIASLQLVVFADRVCEILECSSADELVAHVAALRYDGGTNLQALERAVEDLMQGAADHDTANDNPGQAFILFTDGIDTLTDEALALPSTCNALAIVSGTERDVEAMRQACAGLAVDLAQAPQTADELQRMLSHHNPNRLADLQSEGIADVCDASTPGSRRRAIIGRLCSEESTIALGAEGSRITLRADEARQGDVLAKAWAARKVAQLAPRSADYSDELLALGRQFGVVSPATSLLVLESLDQWLRYDIEPPETLPKMREEWRTIKAGEMHHSSQREREANHRRRLAREWEQLLEWWKHDYSAIPDHATTPESATSRYCPVCGGKSTANAAFCIYCGSRINAPRNNRTDRFDSYGETTVPPMMAQSAYPSPSEHEARRAAPAMSAPRTPLGQIGHAITSRFFDRADTDDLESFATPTAFEARMITAAPVSFDAAAPAPVAAAAAPTAETSDPVSADKAPASPSASVSIKPWTPNAPYLKALDNALTAGLAEARDAYFEQRSEYRISPSFFLDCAGWFASNGDEEFGLRVLTNLAELRIEDAALLRVMAWRLREAGQLEDALVALHRIARLRNEDSQSHRDLALVLDELARLRFAQGNENEARQFAQEAGSLYRKCALTPWERRPLAIGLFAVEEYNVLRAWANAQTWDEAPDLPSLGRDLEGVLDCDLRITLAWDADETDVDIHVTEPSGEEAYFGNRHTFSGGRVSEDITDGYGPELYEIRTAQEGAYEIRAHYYASHQQTIFGPATCTLTVYTDWGRPEQEQRITSTRLDKEREMVPIGSVKYGEPQSETAVPTTESATTRMPERGITAGMTADDVLELMGEPSEKIEEGEGHIWIWSRTGGRAIAVRFAGNVVVRVSERLPWGEEVILRQ